MTWLVYKHTCSATQKSYIGVTKNLSKRTTAHKHKSSRCCLLYNAIQKHGWNTFTTKVLVCDLTLEDANRLEQNLIAEHNTLAPNGYNLQPGGRVREMPQQTRDKMQAHWDRLRGVPRSEQVREKISSALTGKNKPRRVIEAMLKGQHPITEATREKLSAAKRNKRLPSAHVDSIRKSRTGKVWITDGLTTRSVGVSTVVPSGWRRGRTF